MRIGRRRTGVGAGAQRKQSAPTGEPATHTQSIAEAGDAMRTHSGVVAVDVAIANHAHVGRAAVAVYADAAAEWRGRAVAGAAVTPEPPAGVRCVGVKTVAAGVVGGGPSRSKDRVVRVSAVLLVLLVALDGRPATLVCCRRARIGSNTRSAASCPGGRPAHTVQTGACVVASVRRDTGVLVAADGLQAVSVDGRIGALVGVEPEDRAPRETGVRGDSRLCIRRVPGTACPGERRENVLRLGEDEAAGYAGRPGRGHLGQQGAARDRIGVDHRFRQMAVRLLEVHRPRFGAGSSLLCGFGPRPRLLDRLLEGVQTG